MRPKIANVLAERYASTEMLDIWASEAKIIAERKLWITIMGMQRELGMDIPEAAITAYESAVLRVDLKSIDTRERVTRHDVKARLEEFNALAGYEHAHKGMTSRDLTENIEQAQMARALRVVQWKLITVLGRLAQRAAEYADLPMAGRSHNVAAQMTTLGKRFASFAEELHQAYLAIREFLDRLPLRGIKGPVGTQQDMLHLFGGNAEKVANLEAKVAKHLEFNTTFTSVGQVYPRSVDLEALSRVLAAAATLSSFATTIRLMAGQELVTEGFKEGQVGSSAMPHKMNARSSERICGFYHLLRGYHAMIEGPAGSQWNEGDVSCSVVRRVAIQDAFLAMDGLLETALTVLDEFGAYPAVIEREINRFLPFLASTKLLMSAIQAGVGRETAHACIKEHAVAAALKMRGDGVDENPFLKNLCADTRFPLSESEAVAVIGKPIEFIGLAQEQTALVVEQIEQLCRHNPVAASYTPESIL